MTVTLGGKRLWQAQETRLESSGRMRQDSVLGEDSQDTLLTGLESLETFEYTGRVTGLRLSLNSGAPSDPMQALAEWVVDIETMVNGAQGTGYTLDDDNRDRTINTAIEMVGWQKQKGAKYEVNWDLALTWGHCIMPDYSSDPPTVNPREGPDILDGQEITNIETRREQKRQELEEYPIAFADPGGDEIVGNSGAVRQILLRGDAVGTRTERNSFDNHMLNLLGQDTIVQYESAFPGRTLDVMVTNYESVREAGVTRKGEYIIELVEGLA